VNSTYIKIHCVKIKIVWFVFQVIVLDQTIQTVKNSMEQTDDCKKHTRV